MGIRGKIEEIRSRAGLSNIRLDQLRNSVRALKNIEDQQSREIEQLRIELKKTSNEINRLRTEQRREIERRDIWARKEAEVKRLAKGKKVLVIKCPHTEVNKEASSDYAYCNMIKGFFEKNGYFVLVDCWEDWNCSVNADVVLVMHGYRYYHPDRRNAKTKYVMWINCRTDMITTEELNLYDLIITTSEAYTKRLRKVTEIPVDYIPNLTDVNRFYPNNELEQPKYNCVFVGLCKETRGLFRETRDCIRWCEENEIHVDVWGNGWEELYSNSKYVHLHGRVEYNDLPEIYRNARFSLNDHFQEMLASEMMNNRFPEVLLCGTPMICDWAESFERDYGDMVLFYRNEEEFVQCIQEMDERYDELKSNVMKNQERLREEFDFQKGIARMQELIESCGEEGETK